MERSKLYHKEVSYNSGIINPSVNMYNGRLLTVTNDLTVGSGNFEINVGLVYNSHFKELEYRGCKIGIGGGWKLNVQQYVFPYSSDFDLQGFNVGDYVYIDQLSYVHRFIKYGQGSQNKFYDEGGTGLRLIVTNNGSEIIDSQGNKSVFDSYGRIIKIISAINENIEKIIEYQDGYIYRIYDNRNFNNCIWFAFENDKLKLISNRLDNTFVDYYYNDPSTYKINKITKRKSNINKDLAIFDYTSRGNLNKVIDPVNGKGFIFYYHDEKTYEKSVNVIIESYSKAGYKYKQAEEASFFTGDLMFSGGDEYCGEMDVESEIEYDVENSSIIRNRTALHRLDKAFCEVQKDSITEVYYFDADGRITAHFEEIKKEGSSKVTFKNVDDRKGVKLEIDSDEIKTTFYGLSYNILNSNNTILTSANEIIYNDFWNGPESTKYVQDFNLSFYMVFPEENATSITELDEFYIKVYREKEESLNLIGKLHVNKMPFESCALVNVPIKFDNYENFDNLILNLPFKDVGIFDVRLAASNLSKVKIDDCYLDDFTNISWMIASQGTTSTRNLILNEKNYFTFNDLIETYKSAYKSYKNNILYYDIILNKGTKVYEGFNLTFDSSSVSKNIEVSEPKSNLSVVNRNKNSANSYLDNIVEICFNTSDDKYQIKQINKMSYVVDSLNYDSSSYSITNFNGQTVSKVDEYGVITEYIYDNYGNILSECVSNNELPNDTITITYSYDEHNGEQAVRTIHNSVTENGITTTFEYANSTNDLISITNGKLKVKYEYDHFYEYIKNVSFIDVTTNQLLFKNDLYYDCTGKLKHMIDNKGIIYSFDEKIGDLSVSNSTSRNNVLIQEDEMSKKRPYIINSENKESSVSYFKKQIINDSSQVYTSKEHYDKYGRLALKENNSKKINYTYCSDDSNMMNIHYINDPYTNNTYEILYDGSNNNTGYKIISDNLDDQIEVNNITSSKKEIKFIQSNTVRTSKVYYENSRLDSDDQFLNTSAIDKIQTYLNDGADLGILTSPRLFRTCEYNSSFNNYNIEFNYIYRYDKLGRLNKIINTLSCDTKDNNDYYRALEENRTYKPNTQQVNEVEYKVKVFDDDGVEKKQAIMYNYYTYDNLGNIKQIQDGGNYFASVPTDSTASTIKNDIILYYEYDVLNRLKYERNGYLGTFYYDYNNDGQLSKVNKDGETFKEFSYKNGRLSSFNGSNITYDTYGNITSCKDKSYLYNDRNMLERVVFSDNSNINFSYNYQNIRYLKTKVNSSGIVVLDRKSYLDGDRILSESIHDYVNNKTHKLEYFYNANGICGIRYDGYNFNLVKDLLGNVTKVMHHGKLIAEYVYDAWGNHEIIEVAISNDRDRFVVENNPFRYRGYYYDVETQLFYCNSRYYSPELCRWISPDSIEYLDPQSINGLNLYCYCANNPIMYVDPSGHAFIAALLISMGIAALIGGATAGYSAYQSGERGWDLVADIAGGAIFGAAVGATIALGGAAGLAATGASVAGFGLSTGAALGISVGATAVAGMAKYSLDCVASNENNWNFGGFVLSGVEGALQGAATFGLAFVGGKSGLFNKLGNFRTADAFYINHGGMNTLRAVFWGSKVLIGETLSKALFVSGSAALARWLIDLMIPDLY